MTSIQAPAFPSYSRPYIRLQNLLVTRRPELHLKINDQALVLQLGTSTEPVLQTPNIELTAANARSWINISEDLFHRLSASWLGNQTLGELPAPLQKAVLNAALSPILNQLHSVSGIDLVLTHGDSSPADSSVCLALWQPSTSGRQMAAVLRLDNAALDMLIHALEHMPTATRGSDWSFLAIPLTIAIARISMPVKTLRSVELNDLLLLPPGISPDHFQLILHHNHHPLAIAHLENRSLLIDRLLETTMPNNDHESPSPGLSAEDLEIKITFDLGHLTLPLSELQNMQVGYSFELDMPAAGKVRILCGEQLIGRGELVQIDDRLGVRVNALFNQSDV